MGGDGVVSGLPAALAPWAARLAPFAPDLALTLGEWVRRIALAVGPMSGRRSGDGEPDGLAGLSRRGPYERLLLSEWLLADEIPQEFTRRAAAGEHLFLDRNRCARSAGRRCVALLDAGPDQLGAPRIAQLALLVVLATRADAAGAQFAWGLAQHPSRGLRDSFSSDDVRCFLELRTDRPPSDAALAGWMIRLPPPAARDDLWVVGGAGAVRSAPPGASRLFIEDVTEPGARQVRLLLEARPAERRKLVLDLPSRADCTRLLRDPFRNAAAKPVRAPGRISPEAKILFSPSGRRIAVRLHGTNVLDVHVPSSPRDRPANGDRLAGGPGLVSLGWNRKRRSITASVQGGAVVIARGTGKTTLGQSVPGHGVPLPVAPSPLEGLGPCHLWPAGAQRAWMLDSAGVLHQAQLGGSSWVVSAGVTALYCSRSRLWYVACRSGALELVAHTTQRGRHTWDLGPGTGRAFLSAPSGRLLVAAEDAAGGTWTVRLGTLEGLASSDASGFDSTRQLRPPSGTLVVGALLSAQGEPALLLLEEDRRDFTLLDRHGLRLVYEAVGEVATASVSPVEPTLAYATRSGALVAYSLDREAVLLHLWSGGST